MQEEPAGSQSSPPFAATERPLLGVASLSAAASRGGAVPPDSSVQKLARGQSCPLLATTSKSEAIATLLHLTLGPHV